MALVNWYEPTKHVQELKTSESPILPPVSVTFLLFSVPTMCQPGVYFCFWPRQEERNNRVNCQFKPEQNSSSGIQDFSRRGRNISGFFLGWRTDTLTLKQPFLSCFVESRTILENCLIPLGPLHLSLFFLRKNHFEELISPVFVKKSLLVDL